MKRKFEVRFYFEKWKNDEEVERFDGQGNFECEAPDTISFNGKGIFGIVSKAFVKDELERFHRHSTVTSVMELPN